MPSMILSLVALTLAQVPPPIDAAPGPAIVQEGFSFRPPAGFRTERMTLFHGSEVGAVTAAAPEVARRLVAVLMDGEGAGAAVMLVAAIEEGFTAIPARREPFASLVVTHFASLGLSFSLDRAVHVPGSPSRIEVYGTLKEVGSLRSVLVAVIPGEARHVVVTLSAPAGRFEDVVPEVRASIESFRVDPPTATKRSRRVLGALAGALAGALIVSVAIWRRRAGARG